jgi:hypothetical protein
MLPSTWKCAPSAWGNPRAVDLLPLPWNDLPPLDIDEGFFWVSTCCLVHPPGRWAVSQRRQKSLESMRAGRAFFDNQDMAESEDIIMTIVDTTDGQERFELEAEFVQLLSNPFYLQCTSFYHQFHVKMVSK